MTEEKNSLLHYFLVDPQQEERTAIREMDDKRNLHEYSYGELLRSFCNFGRLLKNRGDLGEHIPILLDTSFDFLRVFFGIIAAKKVCVPIHTIAHNDSIEFILNKVRAKAIVVTQISLYRKLVEIDYVKEHIHTIFCSPAIIEQKQLPCDHVDICNLGPIKTEEATSEITEIVAKTNADDPIQIVFTSGTTGEPKGVVLSHKNLVSCVVRSGKHLGIDETFRTLTFLPLSHVMAQNEAFIALLSGGLVQMVGRDHILHGLRHFEPNILVAVPRVYQAVYNGIQRKLRNKNFTRKLLEFSVRTSLVAKRDSFFLKRMIAGLYANTIGKVLTSKVKKGIGNFKIMITAGAACPEHIYDFFEGIGLPLTNGQGLTEVSGAVVYNEPGKTYKTSIGFPLEGVELKVAEDNEILMKGEPVFKGYFEEPELTKEAFTEDGFFKTGDLGKMEHVNGKDYFFILGRKKEIVVLSSGLNIPPVQIEEKLLQRNLIHQAMVVGDGKPILGALIVPEVSENGNGNTNIREEISKVIRQVNMQMDSSEKIGQFEIVQEPFTVENGMLTPTMKIRRLAVSQRYEGLIGNMYQSSGCLV